MKKDYSILIGGKAGQGSRKAGLIIAKLFSKLGYQIFIYDDYQSLIRRGHNFSQIRASEEKVLSHRREIDFLLALDDKTLEKHKSNLKKGGIAVYDSSEISFQGEGVPLKKIVEKFKGTPTMKNTALVGAFAKLAGIDWGKLEELFKEEFEESAEINLKIAQEAFEKKEALMEVKDLKKEYFPLLTGNEALCLGAVKAGLDLYFAYPMTPASGILHFLAEKEKEFNLRVVQLENEIAVANGALGASYGGARTMVGTSGGGFALMTEALSLAAQSEIPLVMVESQRMSPGSGVPTYTQQGDLLFNLRAGHGDFVRFVIAPGDAEETAFWAGKIMNLSWKYQTPSILLIDKEVSESTFSFDKKVLEKIKKEKIPLWDKKGDYFRYKDTKKGISPLAFPGEKGALVKSNGYEHNEFGLTVEDEKRVKKMQEKRLRKFKEMKKEVNRMKAVEVYGDRKSPKALVVWGSTKGPAKEAAERMGIKMIQPLVLEPFPEKEFKKALQGVEKIALAETNALGQLGWLLSSFGVKADKKILKYDARPFLPEELMEELKDF